MVHFRFCALLVITAHAAISGVAKAQQLSAYDLLPQNTQAVVWIRNSDELVERWNRTQLSKLLEDESIAPFFNAQREEIEQRFMKAGWRLNFQPDDLGEFASGEIAIAWTSKENKPLKPFGLALIADVEDDPDVNKQMMQKFEQQLDPRTKKSSSQHAGVKVTKYGLPPRAGELVPQDSFFAVVGGKLLSADDADLLKQLIDRTLGNSQEPNLSQDKEFIESRRLAKLSDKGHVEYFVRPIGFAKVIRSIGGKRSKSDSDMLAVLESQGFDAIQCISGEVSFGMEEVDVLHHGYVLAETPLPKSAGILDFANDVTWEVPNFVSDRISTFLSTNWNAEDAFWKAEGLVDAIAGTEGVFDEVVEGIKKDPNGPQIDIAQNFLPQLTNQIYSISDSKEGDADVDSRRNLIALRVKDGINMADVIQRAMENEPDASKIQYEGVVIWQVEHPEVAVEEIEGFDEFGGGSFGDDDFGKEPEHVLNNWAIAVDGEYLMFASHVDMIKEAISQANAATISPLTRSEDYQRVVTAITRFFGEGNLSAWQLSRTEEAYRVQYELFRKGELRQSQSMLATVLDRILENDTEIKEMDQKIKGTALPGFDEISSYLEPSGVMARTAEKGWTFGSFMLGKKGDVEGISLRPQLGTAQRASTRFPSSRR